MDALNRAQAQRPVSLLELLPQVDLKPHTLPNETNLFAGERNNEAFTRQHLLAVIDSALATIDVAEDFKDCTGQRLNAGVSPQQ